MNKLTLTSFVAGGGGGPNPAGTEFALDDFKFTTTDLGGTPIRRAKSRGGAVNINFTESSTSGPRPVTPELPVIQVISGGQDLVGETVEKRGHDTAKERGALAARIRRGTYCGH